MRTAWWQHLHEWREGSLSPRLQGCVHRLSRATVAPQAQAGLGHKETKEAAVVTVQYCLSPKRNNFQVPVTALLSTNHVAIRLSKKVTIFSLKLS